MIHINVKAKTLTRQDLMGCTPAMGITVMYAKVWVSVEKNSLIEVNISIWKKNKLPRFSLSSNDASSRYAWYPKMRTVSDKP